MKRKSKSAPLKGLFLAAALAGLAACDSIHWPHVYGPNEVPQSVQNEPRLVAGPPATSETQNFPRLGDVPPMPKNFTPEATIDRNKRQMEDQRAEGEALRRQVEESPTAE